MGESNARRLQRRARDEIDAKRTTAPMDGSYAVRPRARAKGNDVSRPVPYPPGYDPRARGGEATRARDADRTKSSTGTTTTAATMDESAMERERSKLREQRAFAFAKSSVSSIAMMVFMMWMSGNSVQVFSIMAVFGGVAQTTKAILHSRATFERFVDGDKNVSVAVPRLMFCGIQLIGLYLALNKLNNMGLLPTHASDWVSGMNPPRQLERAYGGVEL